MSHQTLDSGETPDARFARISSPKQPAPGTPEHIFMILCGFPGAGKTSLMLSCPDAYILNLDRKEVPRLAEYKAGVWPTKNEDGQLLDVDGSPFLLEWNHVVSKVEILEDLARRNQPRPSIVVIDTIAAAVEMIQNWMIKEGRVTAWEELGDGRQTWTRCFTHFINLCARLSNAGYGVYLLCHLAHKTITTQTSSRTIVETTVSDGLWRRLMHRADLCLAVLSETRTVSRPQVTTLPDGRSVTRQVSSTEQVRILTSTRSDLDDILRSFTSMPEIELSPDNGWSDFMTAYTSAVSTTNQE